MQNFTNIPSTRTLSDSLSEILNNDKTAISCSSGTAFPTANLQLGMLCFRTDNNKLYILKATSPSAVWVEIMDVTASSGKAPNAEAVDGIDGAAIMLKANNLSDIQNASLARTNLGLAIGTNVQAQLVSGTNIKTINSTSLLGPGNIPIVGAIPYGLFRKADPTIVAWTKTGAFAVSTATTIYVEVNGDIKTIAFSTPVTMPGSATTGTDYAIWAKTDGTLEATTNHTSPPSANARKIGGFHYAPGGNSAGNTTPQINEYSFWDLKFRPSCPDPRGMTLVAGGFWIDIYLTGVDAITNGSSKYNVPMADGYSPPKVPTMFGGNGSTTYGSYTWFEAMELATAFGKRCPTQQEFMSAAYGTTEASSIGTDQVSTILNASYTSKLGVIQATGVLWVWGCDRGGAYNTSSWNANTEGRGSERNAPNAALFGGAWNTYTDAGSRCSDWYSNAASYSNGVGSRFVCDHLQLD